MSDDLDLGTAQEEFGPYLVYERLGVGGMATVHRALERGIEGFERIVALKRLLPHLAEDASFIKAFVREAKLASLLQHGNIVQILELGRVATSYFISMEFIDGRDVRRILRHARRVSGPPPINVTMALMLQLCDALDYAHGRCDADGHPLGLVHRDLSPSNLIVNHHGHIKVIDFGIAKAQSAHLKTQTGRVKGKLAYMAPEAISGKELDRRSDLFSLGVVFHEMLTARPLFAQKNEYQTLLKVQRGDVTAPSVFNEAVPPELDEIVLQTLARDPDERWDSASELRDALNAVRTARQLSATPRDVTAWCAWAFALEVPGAGAFSGSTFGGASGTGFRTPTPAPRRQSTPKPTDDDMAIELAWGAPEHESGMPVVLDEVPDVSHKAPSIAALAAAAATDTDPSKLQFDPVDPAASITTPMPRAATGPAVPDTATTQPSLPVLDSSTIKTLAVPPPQNAPARKRGETQPAFFPSGSSDDALSGARKRPSSMHPVVGRGSSTALAHGSVGPRPSTASELLAEAAVVADAEADVLSLLDDGPTPVTRPPSRRSGPSTTTIGAAIAARKTHPVRNTLIGLGVVGGIAVAITLAVTMGSDDVAPTKTVEPPPAAPVRTTGTVKFAIEPADATVKIAGRDPVTLTPGTPWQTELEPGAYQVEISRDGYEKWVTSVEMSVGDQQVLRVVLEQVAKGKSSSRATARLIVDSSPRGLEVVLDGEVLDKKTPLKLEVKPGPHEVVLREKGADVWSEKFVAEADTKYEFNPSMSDDKRDERRRRRDRERDRERERDDDVIAIPRPPTPAAPPVVTTTPAIPTPVAPPAPPKVDPPKVAPPPPAPTLPPAPPRSSAPEVVPPGKVTRLSGDVPTIRSRDGSELPATIASKICIDTRGAVTSASILSKVPSDVAEKLERAIRRWKYTPYHKGTTAAPACFVASFRPSH